MSFPSQTVFNGCTYSIELETDVRARDDRCLSIDSDRFKRELYKGGWQRKGCQKIAFLMRISDMYSNLP